MTGPQQMNLRHYFLTIGIAAMNAIGSFGADEESYEPVEHMPITDIDPKELPETTRIRYIERIKSTYTDRKRLIRLRDGETINRVIQEWEEWKGRNFGARRDISGSASPWMIPELAKFLYYDEEPPTHRIYPHPEMKVDLGFSHTTAVVIRDILIQAPEVPVPVKNWASRYDNDYYQLMLVDMRHWWEANRQSLEDQQYNRLEPLLDADMKTEFASSEAIEKAHSLPTGQPTASPNTDAQEISPAISEATAKSRNDQSRLWPYGLAAILAALGIGVIIYRLRAS